MAKVVDQLERQELIQKLLKSEYKHEIETLLANDTKFTTKRGRCNKSGACRLLDCKTKQLENIFAACRKILGND